MSGYGDMWRLVLSELGERQREIGEALGCSQAAVNDRINGRKRPAPTTVWALAVAATAMARLNDREREKVSQLAWELWEKAEAEYKDLHKEIETTPREEGTAMTLRNERNRELALLKLCDHLLARRTFARERALQFAEMVKEGLEHADLVGSHCWVAVQRPSKVAKPGPVERGITVFFATKAEFNDARASLYQARKNDLARFIEEQVGCAMDDCDHFNATELEEEVANVVKLRSLLQ